MICGIEINMSDLANEYRKRHNLSGICFVNEGVLFLERKGEPALICISSTHSKSLTTCDVCSPNMPHLTVELCTGVKMSMTGYRVARHAHVPPDEDILEYIYTAMAEEENCSMDSLLYEPFTSRNDRDQEEWLWRFYLHHCKPLASTTRRDFERFCKRLSKGDPNNFIAEMTWCATHTAATIVNFYNSFYSSFLINRMYMLMG